MKRKLSAGALTLLSLMAFAIGLSGCQPRSEIVLPVLFYHQQDAETVSVQLGKIDCLSGEVEIEGDAVYETSMDPGVRQGKAASVWDGQRIVIPGELTDVRPLEAAATAGVQLHSSREADVFGPGCQVEILRDGGNAVSEFVVTTVDGQVIHLLPWQLEEVTIGDDEHLVSAQYDNEAVTLIFLKQPRTFSIPPEQWPNTFHQLVYTVGDQQTTTMALSVPEEADIVGNRVPIPAHSGIIGGKYYFLDGRSFSTVDLNNAGYGHYDDYAEQAVREMFASDQFAEIAMFGLTVWESCCLLDYQVAAVGVNGHQERLSLVLQNDRIQAALRLNYREHRLTVYDAQGKVLNAVVFDPDELVAEMSYFTLPRF